jgi:hypothetical protein
MPAPVPAPAVIPAPRGEVERRNRRGRWRGAPLTVKVDGPFGVRGIVTARSSGGKAPPPPHGAPCRSSAQFIDGAVWWSASLHAYKMGVPPAASRRHHRSRLRGPVGAATHGPPRHPAPGCEARRPRFEHRRLCTLSRLGSITRRRGGTFARNFGRASTPPAPPRRRSMKRM